DGSLSVTQTATAAVPEAPLTASGTPFTASAGLPFGLTVATFSDANTFQDPDPRDPAPGPAYTATIDWGDGTALDSDTTAFDTSLSSVFGSHTYDSAGTYTVTVTIQDDESGTATATSTATVSTISASPVSFDADETTPVEALPVARSSDTQTDSYTATIDWGDGSAADSGVITGSEGGYSVTGSHTYVEGGSFPVTVTIVGTAGPPITCSGTAT